MSFSGRAPRVSWLDPRSEHGARPYIHVKELVWRLYAMMQ